MPPIIDSTKCTACGKCVEICAEDVFYGSKPGEIPIVTYPKECVHFNCCVFECPVPEAIRIRIPLPAMTVYKPAQEKSQ